MPTPPTDGPYLRLQREEEEEEQLPERAEEGDQLTMSERMPEYAREYFDQQQHQNDEQIVEPPYQVSLLLI